MPLLNLGRLHILIAVMTERFHAARSLRPGRARPFHDFAQCTARRARRTALALLLALVALSGGTAQARADQEAQRADFTAAWNAAREGRRDDFAALMPGLRDYLLYPYLQYEDLRFRRAQVPEAEMVAFLDAHADWAFADGLETAWLRALGERGRWDALRRHGADSKDTEVRCHVARARIRDGDTDGLLAEARSLWAVGKSQPDACDPVFDWLRREGGINSGLAWERIARAMEARERRLTRYVARYLDPQDRAWADRWYEQDRGGYRQIAAARAWSDGAKARQIAAYGLRRLARNDPDRAWAAWESLDEAFDWSAAERGGVLADLALWSAVARASDTASRMNAVPPEYRDGRLFEWWARFDIARGDWAALEQTLAAMPQEQRDDGRWRYWRARALLENGGADEGRALLSGLAGEATFFGFLAADAVEQPYSICPLEPSVEATALAAVEKSAGFERALELRRAGIEGWARREWNRALRGLDREGLRAAAALATREDWPDRAIAALGDTGDLRWYAWRFPDAFGELVTAQTERLDLDDAWVRGLMRSESALAADAVSPAGARGLMQLTPDTARQLARRHQLPYNGLEQLMVPVDNIRFGTTYLRELLDRFDGNPVLATAAYNAGPRAVERWLAEERPTDPVAWIETLPYFETRDYVPRVLAFATLYDWRLNRPVVRVSARMPALGGAGRPAGTATPVAEVVCRVSG